MVFVRAGSEKDLLECPRTQAKEVRDMKMVSSTRKIPQTIQSSLDEIRALCREYQVVELEIFGSAVTDDFDPETSDYDFLVEFDTGSTMRPLVQYFGFRDALEQLLGRPVDFVSLRSVRNPYLRANIEEQRIELFAA
jgi:predicted nucleotidyltransferase